MAIAFRAQASVTGPSGAASKAVSLPAGTQQGDFMVAALGTTLPSSGTVTPPTSWSLILRTNDPQNNVIVLLTYDLRAGSSEPSSYTWALSASVYTAGGIVAYSGVDGTSPVDVSSSQSGTNTTSLVAPSVTTTKDGAMVIRVYAAMSNTFGLTITPPSGTTERFNAGYFGSPSSRIVEVADFIQSTHGATGTATATLSATAVSYVAHTIALAPGLVVASDLLGMVGT